MTDIAAFYTPQAGGYQSSVHTRGPWSPEHQHGGPPAALLARAVEQALPQDTPMHVARITFEILRPVPITWLRVATEALHAGRKLQVIDAMLSNADEKPLIRARAVAIRSADMETSPTSDSISMPPGPDNSPPHEFDFFSEDEGYHTAMEMRRARAAGKHHNVAMWMRMRCPLVAGEPPSPLQRVVTAADSGNGVSNVLDPARYTFINPDLNVYLHRPAQGEWVCLEAQTLVQQQGIGLADTRLYDATGPIGRSDQSLIVERR